MNGGNVVIATNASFLADAMGEILRDVFFKVYTAANDKEFAAKLKTVYPRFIFIENCFHGLGTDVFIQRIVKHNRNVHIVVWAAAEMKPIAAARFILAGAESFFSLRDTDGNIETIICRIASGRRYCPADVEAELEKDNDFPAIGEGLTQREIEIIKLSVSGKTNKQIGDILSVSVHMVKFHRRNIYRKCGGNTTVDILRNGLIRGILSPEDFQ